MLFFLARKIKKLHIIQIFNGLFKNDQIKYFDPLGRYAYEIDWKKLKNCYKNSE